MCVSLSSSFVQRTPNRAKPLINYLSYAGAESRDNCVQTSSSFPIPIQAARPRLEAEHPRGLWRQLEEVTTKAVPPRLPSGGPTLPPVPKVKEKRKEKREKRTKNKEQRTFLFSPVTSSFVQRTPNRAKPLINYLSYAGAESRDNCEQTSSSFLYPFPSTARTAA